MTLGNLILTPKATARIFVKTISISRASRLLARKAIKHYYGATRTPFPRRALVRILEGQMFHRLGLLPGNPCHTVFEQQIRNGGIPAIIRDLYLLTPNQNTIRLSDDQTILLQIPKADENRISNYMANGTSVILDLDNIRGWCLSNKRDQDMLNTYNMDRNNPGFMTSWNNYFSVVLPSKTSVCPEMPKVFNSLKYDLNTQQRNLKASHSTLCLFLFLPIISINNTDYDIINNIRFTTTVPSTLIQACTQDLLTWFFNAGNCVAPPYPKVSAPVLPVRQEKDTAPSIPSPNEFKSGDRKSVV